MCYCRTFPSCWELASRELCFTFNTTSESSLRASDFRFVFSWVSSQKPSLTTLVLSVRFHGGQTSGRPVARRHWAPVSVVETILCPLRALTHAPEWTGGVWVELCHTKSAVCVSGWGNCCLLFSAGFTVCVSVFLPFSLLWFHREDLFISCQLKNYLNSWTDAGDQLMRFFWCFMLVKVTKWQYCSVIKSNSSQAKARRTGLYANLISWFKSFSDILVSLYVLGDLQVSF